MKKQTIKNGSQNNDWKTPPHLLKIISDEFGKYFDPCPYQSKFDGLTGSWGKVNYINPPYSTKLKSQFIHKSIEEFKKGNTCIILIPASTETRDFKALWEVAKEIRFLHKRVKFHGYNVKGEWTTTKTGQSGSMLVILKKHNQREPEVSLLNHI